MTDVDRQIARSTQFLDARREQALLPRKRRRRGTGLAKRAGLIVTADLAIIIATIIFGWFTPIGMGGALLVFAALILVTFLLAFVSLEAPVVAEKLVEVPLKALPRNNEQWLVSQRHSLPYPAQTLVDWIGVQL